MNVPERPLQLARPRVAAWRWAANGATLCIAGLGLLAVGWRGSSVVAAGLIVLAALVDGADGALARRAGGPTRAGAALDIVGDFTAFGVAPAALSLTRAPAHPWPLVMALRLFLAAALARLIRSASLVLSKPAGLYVGLPMPTAGCLVAGLALSLPAAWVAAAVLVTSALAISRRPYPSVPWLWQRRRASLFIFLALTAAVAVWSPHAGLLFGAVACAGYPWVQPIT